MHALATVSPLTPLGPAPFPPVAYVILPLPRLSPLFLSPTPASLLHFRPCGWRLRAGGGLDAAEQDVVDGDVDELDEEADEAHDQKPHARGIGYPGKLCARQRFRWNKGSLDKT